MCSPTEASQITASGLKEGSLFSFLFAKSNVPFKIRMTNPTSQPVHLTLSFYWTETAQDPTAGYTSALNGSAALAALLKPGETKTEDFKLTLITRGHWWAIDMAIRIWLFVPGANPMQLTTMTLKVV